MPDLVPILVSKLVPSVAKALIKLWIGKDDLPNAVAGGTIDALATLLPGGKDLATKTVDRLAHQAARKVAEGLQDATRGLAEEEVEPVLAAIGDTLAGAGVDLKSLLRASLDGDMVRGQLRDAGRALRRDLSERQQSLFDRALRAIATELVERAAELPSFASLESAEILQRLEALSEALDPVRSYLANVDAATRDFEMRYREAVVRRLDRMELFGITVSEESSRKYPLTAAFVRLSVLDDRRGDAGIPRAAEEAIAGSSRLLIRGAAGSGKTTLLHWLAVGAARSDLSGALAPWNGAVPFFLRLRGFIKAGPPATLALPTPAEFPAQVAPLVAGMMAPAWVEKQLADGRGLVLIDGVDEVPETWHGQVRDWILELTASFPRCRFVVSSRPELAAEWLGKGDFEELSIARLGLTEAFLLIDRWHAAVAAEGWSSDLTPEERAERLKAELRRNAPLRRLTDTPVLCAIICALNRERHGALPSSRIGLYRACCEALLHRRERERDIPLPAHLAALELEQKQALLEDLAYWMMRNDLSEAPAGDVDDCVQKRLERFPQRPPALTGTAVRELFVRRAGLLREPVEGVLDFPHKTFMEYLTAQAVVKGNDIRFLLKQAHLQGWRETVKLAAGLAQGPQAQQLLGGLLRQGDEWLRARSERASLQLLAAECLEMSVDVEPALAAEIRKRLEKLVPPRDARSARALAAVGPSIVPYLVPQMEQDWATAVLCVEALVGIDDDAALDVLAELAHNPVPVMIEPLERGWGKSVNPDAYGKRVISVLWKTREELSLPCYGYEPTSLDFLIGLTDLKKLKFLDCKRLKNLGPLAAMTNLQSLFLSGCDELTDLSPLSRLTALRSLGLAECDKVTDLSPLSSLRELVGLNLSCCTELTDLSPLRELPNLELVLFFGMPQIPRSMNSGLPSHIKVER